MRNGRRDQAIVTRMATMEPFPGAGLKMMPIQSESVSGIIKVKTNSVAAEHPAPVVRIALRDEGAGSFRLAEYAANRQANGNASANTQQALVTARSRDRLPPELRARNAACTPPKSPTSTLNTAARRSQRIKGAGIYSCASECPSTKRESARKSNPFLNGRPFMHVIARFCSPGERSGCPIFTQ